VCLLPHLPDKLSLLLLLLLLLLMLLVRAAHAVQCTGNSPAWAETRTFEFLWGIS
jgi:hypothetical protein